MKGTIWLKLLQVTFIVFSISQSNFAFAIYPGDSTCLKLTSRLPEAPVLKPVTWEDIHFSQEITPQVEDKFVIVTNRELVRKRNGLVLSNYRQDKLHYLVVYKKDGKWIVARKKHFKEAFYQIDNLQPSLFFVHGYGKTFPGVVSDGDALNRFYKVSLIIFDWPSRNPELFELKSYNVAKKTAKESVAAFCKTVKEYQEYQNEHWQNHSVKSTLMLHSLGNLIIQKSIERGLLKDIAKSTFNSIILNAPAVASKGHEKWVKKIDFGENIFITSNHKDLSFFGLWWLTFKKYLGAQKEKGSAENVVYVNFSEAAKANHNYFLNPELMVKSQNLKFFYFSILTNKIYLYNEECLFAKKRQSYYLD